MRISQTLRRELVIFSVTLTLLLIVTYSGLLPVYFETGEIESTGLVFDSEARAYDRARQKNPDAPLPQSYSLRAYLGVSELPDEVLAIFPPEIHQEREVLAASLNPDDDFSSGYYFMPYVLSDGQTLYLVQLLPSEVYIARAAVIQRLITGMLFMGIVSLVIWTLGTFWILRRIATRTNNLASWAHSLTLDNCDRAPPGFGFAEFNDISKQLSEAFVRITEILEREQTFLRYASHELRTPIATIRSNVELMIRHAAESNSERAVERIERAAKNMQQVTETLLWLSRENGESIPATTVMLEPMIEEILEEHAYLLQDKPVEVCVTGSSALMVPETPCKIALSNLIRNAMQYTDAGTIHIEFDSDGCTIRNHNTSPDIEDEHGYGLGLILVQKIVDRMGWDSEQKFLENGREISLRF